MHLLLYARWCIWFVVYKSKCIVYTVVRWYLWYPACVSIFVVVFKVIGLRKWNYTDRYELCSLAYELISCGIETLPGFPFLSFTMTTGINENQTFIVQDFVYKICWQLTQNTTSTQSREMVEIADYHESTIQNRWLPSDPKRSYCGIISKEEW